MKQNRNLKLASLQEKIDSSYVDFLKKKYKIIFEYFQSIKEFLQQRDRLIEEMNDDERNRFWEKAINNFPNFSLLEQDEFLINNLKINLEADFTCSMKIFMRKNKYIKNKIINKKYNILTNKSESTILEKKMELLPPFFNFFDREYDSMEYFNIFFELYINAVYFSNNF